MSSEKLLPDDADDQEEDCTHPWICGSDANNDPLCCCEYVNMDGERSHLLAVLCNCEAVDDTFERLVTCAGVPASNYARVREDIADRFRIPWRGGARRCPCAFLGTFVALPAAMWLSQLAAWAAWLLLVLVLLISRPFIRHRRRSSFYHQFSAASFLSLMAVFEGWLVPLLTISWYEHVVFSAFVAVALVAWYKVRTRQSFSELRPSGSDGVVAGAAGCDRCGAARSPRTYHCRACQRCVHLRDHHCVWLDCCIGAHNHRWFVAGVSSLVCALLWGCYLTVTTLCHCRALLLPLFGVIQIPVTCQPLPGNPMMLMFAVQYGLVTALLCAGLLVYQCYLICAGVTGSEHRRQLAGPAANSGWSNWRQFWTGSRPCEQRYTIYA